MRKTMRNVLVYLVGIVLLFPCVLICSDDLLGAFIGLAYCALLWNSPKMSKTLKNFWFEFHKVNLKILYSIG